MSNHSRLRRAPYLSDALTAAVTLSLSGCSTVNKQCLHQGRRGVPDQERIRRSCQGRRGQVRQDPGGDWGGSLKVGALLDGAFFQDLPLAGALQKVEATDVDGTPAYLLAERLTPKEGQVHVSADGKATLLRIVSTKANAGTLDFSEWDAVPPMSPPPADQLVKNPGLG
jgi:hypothetical protein